MSGRAEFSFLLVVVNISNAIFSYIVRSRLLTVTDSVCLCVELWSHDVCLNGVPEARSDRTKHRAQRMNNSQKKAELHKLEM